MDHPLPTLPSSFANKCPPIWILACIHKAGHNADANIHMFSVKFDHCRN